MESTPTPSTETRISPYVVSPYQKRINLARKIRKILKMCKRANFHGVETLSEHMQEALQEARELLRSV